MKLQQLINKKEQKNENLCNLPLSSTSNKENVLKN